jgi:hypothetical protein
MIEVETECTECFGDGVVWRCCKTPKQCTVCPRPSPCRKCWGLGSILSYKIPLDNETE